MSLPSEIPAGRGQLRRKCSSSATVSAASGQGGPGSGLPAAPELLCCQRDKNPVKVQLKVCCRVGQAECCEKEELDPQSAQASHTALQSAQEWLQPPGSRGLGCPCSAPFPRLFQTEYVCGQCPAGCILLCTRDVYTKTSGPFHTWIQLNLFSFC